ncbi:MAG: sulfatase [Bryobacteraceae bacterium]
MISRRDWITSAIASSASGAQAQRTNVILMVADDLNTDLGCYGNPLVKTPHLDRLASRGVQFDAAHCQFPLCAPSRASFLSGRRPETTRVLSLSVPTRKYMADVVMLPELFRKNGWFTGQTGKIYHTGPEHEDPRSWDYALPESGKSPPQSDIVKEHIARKPRNHSMSWHQLKTPDEQTPDGIVVSKAVELMREKHGAGKPFFLGVGFRRPHSPYAAPRKYFDLYDPAKIPLPDAGDRGRILPAAWYEIENQPRLSEREQREYRAAYYACNSFMDARAGVVLRAMDELKLWDNTVVVFVGDNGYHTGEHGMWHKMTLFEESTRVPLIVYAPGMPGNGKRCRGLVEFVDIYPTVTELCGVKPPAGLEGVTLRPWLNDPLHPGKNAVYSMVGRSEDRNVSHREPTYFGRSVRTGRWRYTEWDGGRRGVELYDHENDPREMTNVATDARYAGTIAELKELLGKVPVRHSAARGGIADWSRTRG